MTTVPDLTAETTPVQRATPIGLTKPTSFAHAPMLVYWESTRACDLACVHCRAEAVSWRNPLELDTQKLRGC
jgi:MoaA/NifB/PqqE/SkfB family radical SAM enzyme